MSNRNSSFYKIIDTYLYTELYKRDAIKSKSFTFSNSVDDIRSKVMYIIKSLAGNLIKDNSLEEIFININFSRSCLMLKYKTPVGGSSYYYGTTAQSLKAAVKAGFIAAYFHGYAGWRVDRERLTFNLTFDIPNFEYMYHSAVAVCNIKDIVNAIINEIFYIKSAILRIGEYITEVDELTAPNINKFKYVALALSDNYFCGYFRDRQFLVKVQELIGHERFDEFKNFALTTRHCEEDRSLWVDEVKSSIDDLHYVLESKGDLQRFMNDRTVFIIPAPQVLPEVTELPIDTRRYITLAGEKIFLP